MEKRNIVSTEVYKAELYYTGARVYRRGHVSLQSGTNKFFLEIPVCQKIKDLAVDFLHPVTHLFLTSCGEKTIQQTSDERKEKEQDLKRIDAQQSALLEQAAAYKKNTVLTGHMNISIKEIEEYLEKLPDVLTRIQGQIDELDERKNALKEELKDIEDSFVRTVEVYQASLSVPEEGTYEFELNYCDNSIFWDPFYDVRVADTTRPLDFQLKAKITMNTGEDWANTSLELFSGALSEEDNYQPQLYPWYVDVRTPYRPVGASMAPMHTAELLAPKGANFGDVGETTILSSAPEQVALGTMRKYTIPQMQEVRSGKQQTILDILSLPVAAEFFYATTPKIEQNVFLIAKIQEVTAYDLLPCNVNLYLSDIFRGTTYLAPGKAEQTLMLSLGRDPSIEVSRKTVKTFTQNRLGKRSRQFEYEIQFSNKKNETIRIDIYDQIPVSRNKDIMIDNIQIGDSGSIDSQTGKVVWAFSTPPQASYALRFGFTVTWPKDVQINL